MHELTRLCLYTTNLVPNYSFVFSVPAGWTVCSLSVVSASVNTSKVPSDSDYLVVSRIAHKKKPILHKIPLVRNIDKNDPLCVLLMIYVTSSLTSSLLSVTPIPEKLSHSQNKFLILFEHF